MKTFCKTIISALIGLGVVVGFSPLVFAQMEDEDIFMLEEITVTSEKREVNVQDSPASITAITGSVMRDKAYTTLDNLLQNVSTLQVQQTQAGSEVFIRGVGNNVPGSDASTVTMMDGVFSSRPESVTGALYDISRVEVLKGPQGTLYGRNALSGTVNIISNSPKINEYGGTVNFILGDYNLRHVDGAINMPISDKTAARLAFLRELRDGYLSNDGANSDKTSFRAKILFMPTEDISFLTTIERNEDRWNGPQTLPIAGSGDGNLSGMPMLEEYEDDLLTNGWTMSSGYADDPWASDIYHPANTQNMTTTSYSVNINWDLGWSELTAIPSYVEYSLYSEGEPMFGTAANYASEASFDNEKQYAGEIRLSSPSDSALKWIVGYYGYNKPAEDEEIQNPSTYDDDAWHYVTYPSPSKTHAVFGQTTIPLTDVFRVTAGLRYFIDDRSRDYAFGNSNVDPSDPLYADAVDGVYYSGILHYSNKVTHTTWKAGMEYDFNDDSMLYATISTGFKAGGLRRTTPPTVYEPEELMSFEIGSKNRFLDNRLQINTAAYYYLYDQMHIQVQSMAVISDITGELAFAPLTYNAEEGTKWGGEFEADYLLSSQDRLSGSLTYMGGEYGEFVIPYNATFGPWDGDYDLEGTEMANSPEWVATLEYQHTWIMDDGAEVTAGVNTRLSTGYYVTTQKYLVGAYQDGYSRSGATVSYRTPEGRWIVSLWAKNLENKAQTTYVFPFYRKMVTNPRTIGVNISCNF